MKVFWVFWKKVEGILCILEKSQRYILYFGKKIKGILYLENNFSVKVFFKKVKVIFVFWKKVKGIFCIL